MWLFSQGITWFSIEKFFRWFAHFLLRSLMCQQRRSWGNGRTRLNTSHRYIRIGWRTQGVRSRVHRSLLVFSLFGGEIVGYSRWSMITIMRIASRCNNATDRTGLETKKKEGRNPGEKERNYFISDGSFDSTDSVRLTDDFRNILHRVRCVSFQFITGTVLIGQICRCLAIRHDGIAVTKATAYL